MLKRDEINEKLLMDQIRPIIEGQSSISVMALAVSLIEALCVTSKNPKTSLLQISKYFLDHSNKFNQDGTIKSDEELEK